MKILSVTSLALKPVVAITFARFRDNRGYFTEHFRQSDFRTHPELPFFKNIQFVQANESYSKQNVVRGLHLQWQPNLGKLVRVIQGHMVDFAMDIRVGSPTMGKIVALDMPAHPEDETETWIWVPEGFAHGGWFREDTTIEYLCTGEYAPGNEAGIYPFSPDIDWSVCEPELAAQFKAVEPNATISDKDKAGTDLQTWLAGENAHNFTYEALKSPLE